MQILTFATTLIALVTTIGGVLVYLQAGRGRALTDFQEKEIQALNQSNTRLEKENAECTAANKVKDEQIAAKDEQIAMLQSVAQQTPEIVKLAASGEKNHRIIEKHLNDIKGMLGDKRK